MIIFKLRAAMEKYRQRVHEKITYAELARRTGIAEGTLHQMGRRLDYHPTLANVEKLCNALGVELTDLLEIVDDPPKEKAKGKKAKKCKKAAK